MRIGPGNAGAGCLSPLGDPVKLGPLGSERLGRDHAERVVHLPTALREHKSEEHQAASAREARVTVKCTSLVAAHCQG